MEALEAILTRRSVRKYKATRIPKDVIVELLRAAMSSPSASNKQPWHFIVITRRLTLNQIPDFHPFASMLEQSPAAIAICGDILIQPDYWIQDCSAATENILLAAHAKGLGAVWLAIYPREPRILGLRKLLRLPENIMPLSLVALGYPIENKLPANRFDQSKIHHNKW
jgi:nitroreductase